MQYVEVPQFGGPEMLHMIDAPDPAPQAGQVVVTVKAIGINFADIAAREGTYPNVPSAPFRPGYEAAGVVTAVGGGVDGFQGGERVMAFVPSGGYATHVVLDAKDAITLPDTLEFGAATALLVQGLTAYFLLEEGGLPPGGSVLLTGAAGGVGSLAVQIARLQGAGLVIGLASPSKHELVRSLGADAAVDYTQAGWAKQVLAQTQDKGVALFLDAQGDLTSEGFEALGEKAHWLIFGSQGRQGDALPEQRLGAIIGKNITLRGFSLFGFLAQIPRALPELIGWASEGKLKISIERFPFADVARAQEAVQNRQTTGKVILEP